MIGDENDPQPDAVDGDEEAQPLPPPNPADNAANPGAQSEKRKRKTVEEREAAEFWQECLKSRAGRRELWKFMAAEGLFDNQFAVGPNGFPQSEATWFAAGKKDVVQRLFMSLMLMDFEGVNIMLSEHHPTFIASIRKRKTGV